jgi:serine/threonine-protein kinase PpkA
MKITGYQIEREIGHGGMATVYQAVQTSLERPVALKVMAPVLAADTTFGERFLKEAKTVASLTHPNILAIHDVGAVGPYNYIAMEYVSGGDLKQRIKQGISAEHTLRVIKQVAAALDHAHHQGIIHRDIKPENILFREDETAVLTDFGIAKSVDSNTQMTITGMSIGTPRYMSPEQAQGKSGLDGRSDLYSLGVVLYESLTGKVPFDAETPVGIALKHVQAAVPELPDDLSRYQALIDNLMAKDPADRYAVGSELVKHIDHILAGKKLPRPIAAKHAASKTPSSGLRWLAAVLVVAVVAGAGIYLTRRKPTDSNTPLPPIVEEKQLFTVPQPSVSETPQSSKIKAGKQPDDKPSGHQTMAPEDEPQQAKIKQLLNSAERDLTAMRLTSPKGNNAAQKYRNVLALEPQNAEALKGLAKIVGKYIMLSDEAISTLSYDQAERYLNSAMQFNLKTDLIEQARKRVRAARNAHAEKTRTTAPPKPKEQPAPAAHTSPKHGDKFSNALGMNFIFVAPGSFMMGSPKSEPGRSGNEGQHLVTLSKGYWLQTTEITQAQWVLVMGSNPSHFKGIDLPVESVSWNDTQLFIEKLNQKENPKITVRLPSEAEWEYAARAGTTTAFAFGNCLSTQQANYIGSSPLRDCEKNGYLKKTSDTGSLAPNAWGFYDMHGNVLEWCQDWTGTYPNEAVTDPAGPDKGRYKVIRGGSWRLGAAASRSAARNRYKPTRRSSSLGFRLAGDLNPSTRSAKP